MLARALQTIAALLVIGGIAGSSGLAFGDCPAADAARARWRPELERAILDGLDAVREESPIEAPFNTSWDWHSSVHAHWALLAMARDSGDSELAERIRSRLTPETLDAWRVRLAKKPNRGFELPYGQAWLVILLGELERIQASPELNALREETQARVITWLEKGSNSGLQHDSWLMSYWLIGQGIGQGTVSTEIRARYEALAPQLAAKRPKLLKKDPRSDDFVSPLALLDLIEGGKLQVAPEDPPARIKFENSHAAGRAFLDLWPFAARAASDSESCEIFSREFEKRMSRPELWDHPYREVSHWVPQYAWMALWLARGANIP